MHLHDLSKTLVHIPRYSFAATYNFIFSHRSEEGGILAVVDAHDQSFQMGALAHDGDHLRILHHLIQQHTIITIISRFKISVCTRLTLALSWALGKLMIFVITASSMNSLYEHSSTQEKVATHSSRISAAWEEEKNRIHHGTTIIVDQYK
jgi:hypothetical protein